MYYDSLVPSFEEILTAESSSLSPCPISNYSEFGFIKGLIALDSSNSRVSLHSSLMWTKSFPFMPLYSHIKRQSNITSLAVQKNRSNSGNYYYDAGNTVPLSVTVNSAFMIEAHQQFDGYTTDRIWGDFVTDGAAGKVVTGLSKRDLFKALYGFGDLNTMRGAHAEEDSTKLYGTTNFVVPRNFKDPTGTTVDGPLYVVDTWSGPIVRGWKYGLINGFPTNTSAVWRRNRFGQFRDMLEQRLFTKFSKNSDIFTSPVEVKFIGPNGTNVLPEQTISSNLSFEATSSLPYFDENVRNREEPIFLSSIYSMRFST